MAKRAGHAVRLALPLVAIAGALFSACVSLDGLVGGPGDAAAPPADSGAGSVDAPIVELDAASSPDALPSFRPPVGLYRFVGTGTDRLNLMDGGLLKEQLQGPDMTASVVPLAADGGALVPDCYTFSLAVSATHSWTLNLCQRGDRLVESSGQDDQVWILGSLRSPNIATWTCAPENLILGPTVERDKQATHLCEGKNTTPANSGFKQGGLLKFLGREVLDIDGKDVPVLHVEVSRTVTGTTQTGTQSLELWMSVLTSLPVRGARSSTVTTSAPFFGQLRYSESSEFQIQSLTPLPPDAATDSGDAGDAGRDG